MLPPTDEPGSEDNTKWIAEAGGKLPRSILGPSDPWAGSYAFRIEEARCRKELGDYARAVDAAVARVDRPATGQRRGSRPFQTSATELALEIALLPRVKKYHEAWAFYDDRHPQPRARRTIGTAPRRRQSPIYGGAAALELARELGAIDPDEARLRNFYRQRAREAALGRGAGVGASAVSVARRN